MTVWQAGMAAICVHSFCRPYALGDEEENLFLPGDLEILRRCDAVLVVRPKSSGSKGTIGEIDEAEKIGIPVFFSIETLRNWMEQGKKKWAGLG